MKAWKWYIELFNLCLKAYGGHSHWIGKYIFRNKLDYVIVGLDKPVWYDYFECYNDGFHYQLQILFFVISWGD